MGLLSSVALAIEPPRRELLQRQPYRKEEGILTKMVVKYVLGQGIFQLIVLMVIWFFGAEFLPGKFEEFDDKKELEKSTYVFNAFVLMNVANLVNVRKLYEGIKISGRIRFSPQFLIIIIFILILQVIIVVFGGRPLNMIFWVSFVFI